MNGVRRSRGGRAIRGAGAVLSLAVVGGCQILALPQQILPVAKIKAEYRPEDRPTAILIDDPHHRLPAVPTAAVIAERIQRDLSDGQAVTVFVEPRTIVELRLNTPDYSTWAIDRIGRSVGAEQVIFVEVESFVLPEPGEVGKPAATAWVRMIDATTGRRLYPEGDPRGRALTTELFMKRLDASSGGARSILAGHLADHLAVDIAKLFYDHKPREVGSEWID